MTAEHVDVLVVGAGISGVGVAARLLRARPKRSLLVLEGRDRVGGTWDVFRYPGVRSDSDLFTLGFPFRPWTSSRAIVGGAAIREYVAAAADAEGVTGHVRFGRRVSAAAWSSGERRWSVTLAGDAAPSLTCRFLVLATGYYRTDRGHLPDLPGADAFAGPIVHPQAWPEHLDLTGRDVVVIGSGAGAVSIVPAVARTARSTTMLQRTPSHVLALPAEDRLFAAARRVLPPSGAVRVARLRWMAFQAAAVVGARVAPRLMGAVLRSLLRRRLPGRLVEEHFTPPYRVWRQRLCIAADGDLLDAIRSGRARVVTEPIDRLVADGLLLASGRHLPADVVVAATGLELAGLGGVAVTVDGAPVDASRRLALRGAMLDGVPNLAFVVGYARASWTLRADLVARWICRLLDRLDRDRARPLVALPEADARARASVRGAVLELDSGYFRRGAHRLPRRGRAPWRVAGHPADALRLLHGRLPGPGLRLLP